MTDVLIADFDFFTTIGGGQKLYRRFVERNPRMTFHFPSRGPDLELKRGGRLPANARPFAHDEAAAAAIRTVLPANVHWFEGDLLADAWALAASAPRRRVFSVVDVPSFRPIAHLVRPALAAHGIAVGRVAIGMVGWLSIGLRNGWEDLDPALGAVIDQTESDSIAAADLRYAISSRHWGKAAVESGLPVVQLDMHDLLDPPCPDPQLGSWRAPKPPDLVYVGRLDKNKGPDLLLRIAAMIPRELIGKIRVAGPDGESVSGRRWTMLLAEEAAKAGVELDYLGTPDDETVARTLLGQRSVVVAPSRSDTFNFVVLEALAAGCPVVISSQTGAAEFLERHHPDIPLIGFDPEHPEAVRQPLVELLLGYDEARERLVRTLRGTRWPTPRMNFLGSLYRQPSRFDAAARRRGDASLADASRLRAGATSRPPWHRQLLGRLRQFSVGRS